LKIKTLISLVFSASLLIACSPNSNDQKAPTPATAEELPIPDFYQDYLNRDVRDDIFYFVLPDRFYNANSDNDMGSKDIAISRGGYDPTSKWHFNGGDMQGLEEKLDYLQNMGITAIWMTPILRNRAMQGSSSASHGYWIIDFTQIDPHFGSNDDLKNLIEQAHKRGMKIFFDIITNHTADVIKYAECHNPDGSYLEGISECKFKSSEQLAKGDKYTPFVPEGEQDLKTPAWLNDPKYYNNQGDSFWQGESAINGDFVGLDDLKTSDPEVVSGFIDIYKNIITEFKPDGFRIDTVKHVDLSFWQEFGPAIINHAKTIGIPNFHIFGEVYSADPAVLSSFTTAGKLPSVLDFGFQNVAAKVFYQGENPQSIQQLFNDDDYYRDADSNPDILMNFLGNHDMGRAGFFINEGMKQASAEEKLERLILSHAFMYFSRGIPVVYYGDEQGFTGDGGDVAARENMFPSLVDEYNDNILLGTTATTADDNFDPSHPVYLALQKFAKIRMTHKALRSGISFNRYFDDNSKVFALSRVDKDERKEYLVVFNTDTETKSIALDTTSPEYQHIAGHNEFVVNKSSVTITLPALSYSILKATQPIVVSADLKVKFTGIEAVGDLRKYTFDVPAATYKTLPLFGVALEIKDFFGKYHALGVDNTPPYSIYVHKDQLSDLKPQALRLTVINFAGQRKTTMVELKPRKVATSVD
jgi:glycosidase